MRLAVDTNVIISAILSDSTTRRILTAGRHQFFFPEPSLGELERHRDLLLEKTKMSEEGLARLFGLLLRCGQMVPLSVLRPHWNAAADVMGAIDPDDTAFIACALAINADAIWTEDRHFLQQSLVKVVTTEELAKMV